MTKTVSVSWLLNRLAGCSFPIVGQAYNSLKKEIEKMPDVEDDITILSLCEQDHIFLRPDLTYQFKVTKGCKRCEEIAAMVQFKPDSLPNL